MLRKILNFKRRRTAKTVEGQREDWFNLKKDLWAVSDVIVSIHKKKF